MKLFLDTSVLSFYFAEDSPQNAEATRQFFDARSMKDTLVVSDFVLEEIGRTTNADLRDSLLSLIPRFQIVLLPRSLEPAATDLMEAYMEAQVLTRNWVDDALHVAYATLSYCDYVVSWNHRHLVNVRKEAGFIAVNRELGLHDTLRIVSPPELTFDE